MAPRSPARVALAWVLGRPGVASTLLGVSRAAQVAGNVAALNLALSAERLAPLDAATAPAEPRPISVPAGAAAAGRLRRQPGPVPGGSDLRATPLSGGGRLRVAGRHGPRGSRP